MTSAASAQTAPPSVARRCTPSATAVATRAPTSASLCPPPPEWIAMTGFQPTNAAASSGRRELRDTATVATSIAAAPRALNSQAAASGDDPATAATGSETSVKTGP